MIIEGEEGRGNSGVSGTMCERAARSVALERAYVHEVYQQREPAPHQAAPRPRVAALINDLEPGSLVCDVGCGSGKYLNINPSVYTVGGDRCSRLADLAREKDNQVVLCDNLALPYRDETFDLVLSVAVIHHFATTERRVRALRELARVLRIGGRLVITVWAMEQRNRKFESQDVLVPWHRPETLSTPSLELHSTTTTSEDDLMQPAYHAYTQSDSDSNKGNHTRKKSKTKKGKSIDPNRPPDTSPSTSSLSSPNETCYSFVRKAIQKLAGGKRSVKPWFLDSWSNFSKEVADTKYGADYYDDYDTEIQYLPIELRRLEDEEVPVRRQTFACSETTTYNDLCINHKSKSLSDILAAQQKSMVRSRSSVPSLTAMDGEEELEKKPEEAKDEKEKSTPKAKPKLVKQKKSINEDDADEDLDKPTDMKDLVKQLPDFKMSQHGLSRKGGVLKQSSLNEELMSTERLREKESVRKNIQKQASLNEDYLFRRQKTLDTLRDSFFTTSATTAKKFQSLKNGLTSKIKTSTTQIEKATVNSFVRILQGWKSHDSPTPNPPNISSMNADGVPNTPPADSRSISSDDTKSHGERRHSKEDGSDSSKDSSLQSDTSVDSEDSFASVIYVPKSDANGTQDPLSPTPLSPGPSSPRMKGSSVPTSPRVKNAPGSLPSPRLKQMPLTMFPIIKPPGSPKSVQPPIQLNKIVPPQTVSKNPESNESIDTNQMRHQVSPKNETYSSKSNMTTFFKNMPKQSNKHPNFDLTPDELDNNTFSSMEEEIASKSKELMEEINKDLEEINKLTADTNSIKPRVLQDTKPYPKITLQTVAEIPEIPQFKGKKEIEEKSISSENLNARILDRKRRERLKQIRDFLKQRPGFVSPNTRTMFPIVRRCNTQEGKVEPTAKPIPRLLSLELFNPETDDMDSDSSGVSSPDSVDSVISVLPEDQKSKTKENDPPPIVISDETDVELETPKSSNSSHSLIEAAAEVAQSLEDTCEAVIRSSPRSQRKVLDSIESGDAITIIQGSSSSSNGSTWSLNKLSPGDLRTLEDRLRSHTSSSGSTSSLERLSPGRRSKERSPKQGSTNNSSWSLNKLSPNKPEGRSLEDNSLKCRRSPTKFPYDSTSSLEGDKIMKSDSFSRLNANEKLVMCKSDILTSNEEEEEKEMNKNSKHHLTEFAEKLSEKLLQEIDQYSKRMSEEDFEVTCSKNPTTSIKQKDLKKKLSDKNEKVKASSVSDKNSQENNSSFVKCKNTNDKTSIKLTDNNVNKCSGNSTSKKQILPHSISVVVNDENVLNNNGSKQSCDVPSQKVIEDNTNIENETTELILPSFTIIESNGNPEITIDNQDSYGGTNQSVDSGFSIESEISIDSFSIEKRSSLKVGQSTDSSEIDKIEISPESLTPRSSASTAPLKPGFSLESSDAGDISGSGSDWSRRDTNSASKLGYGGSTASLGCASTASLASCSDWSKDRKLTDGRSSSEETAPVRSPLIRQKAEELKPGDQRSLQTSLSDTSQESLPSDNGGGAITFHRYYHVFKEGELDQLIEKYVENLHIISSYYDHANWCVVAEKVQVWTI